MLDFQRLCSDKHIPHLLEGHHHCHEGWIQIHCPFCSSGVDGWHMGFGVDKGNFVCWRCGGHGEWDTIAAILRLKSKHDVGAILRKYRQGGVRVVKPETVRKKQAPAPLHMEQLSACHTRYLAERGFDPEQLTAEWSLKGTKGLSGEWNWRIVTPIRDQPGDIVAYTGRAISPDKKLRWKTSRDEDITQNPKQMIYGIERVNTRVLIVEGPSDVWRMGPGAVGLLGIDWKTEQASLLRRVRRRFIMFDPEPQAQERAQKLAHWLAPFPGATEIITDIPSDPGDLPASEASYIMKQLKIKPRNSGR